MVVVADGCNWGEMPKQAAERARNTILGFLLEKHRKIATISDAKNYLLLSLNEAHKRICEKSFPEEVRVFSLFFILANFSFHDFPI